MTSNKEATQEVEQTLEPEEATEGTSQVADGYGVDDIIGGIISRNSDEELTATEEPEEEESPEEPEENAEDEESEDTEETESEEEVEEEEETGIIDDEIIEKYPTLKSLKGKPIEEAFRSYDHLSREFSRRSQELSSFEKRLNELESQKAAPGQKTKNSDNSESDAEELEFPDPYSDDYGKELKKFLKARDQQIESRVASMFEEKYGPYFEEVKKTQHERMVMQTRNSIAVQAGINDADVVPALQRMVKDVGEEKAKRLSKDPEAFADYAAMWIKANTKPNAEKKPEKKAKPDSKAAAQKSKEKADAIRRKNEDTAKSIAEADKGRVEEQDDLSRMLGDIYNRNAERLSELQ